jgi:hypothetical protein
MAYDDLNDKEKIGLLHLRLATIEEFLCSVFDGFHSDIVSRIEAKSGGEKIIAEMKNLQKDYPDARGRKK